MKCFYAVDYKLSYCRKNLFLSCACSWPFFIPIINFDFFLADDSDDQNYELSDTDSESEQEIEDESEQEPEDLPDIPVDPGINQGLVQSAEDDQVSSRRTKWGPPAGNQPVFPPFTKPSGVDIHLAELLHDKEPADFFASLIDDNIFSYIANQTNLFATQYVMTNDVTPAARVRNWVPTDIYEMKRFFGLLLHMGIVRMPNISDYWSQEEMFKNAFVPSIMSRNRFELLLRMVHFADNDENVNNDRLHKIQGLLDRILHNFQTAFEPPELICIDESLIPFRGRLIMRQYIKGKRHKYGIKLFKLCCSGGYTYNIHIYAGRNLDRERTTPTGVVMRLSEPLLNCGRTLVTDNWYTSVDLAKQLLDKQTHLIGTLRKNRKGNPKEVVTKKLKSGESKAMENEDGITIISWRDKRYVLMLSTKHSDSTVEIMKRGKTISKPQVVMDYNDGKSSVDQSDQMTSYQTPLRKTIRWYKKLGIELILNTAVVNAWIMFKQVKQSKMKMIHFRKNIAYRLCREREPEIPPATGTLAVRRSRPRHEMGTKEYNERKPCITCYENAKKTKGWRVARNIKKIRTYCMGCENQPYLCLPCFNQRHRYRADE